MMNIELSCGMQQCMPCSQFDGMSVKDRKSLAAVVFGQPATGGERIGLIALSSVLRRWCAESNMDNALFSFVVLGSLFRWSALPTAFSLLEQNYAFTSRR